MRNARLLTLVLAATLALAAMAIPAFAATASFDIDVDRTATINGFKTVVTVTGTYTCDAPEGGVDQEYSGFGGQVFQEQKGGKYVVSGGFWFAGEESELPLVCDGTPQEWSADVQANVGNEPAVWKNGRVIVNGGGSVCNFECTDEAGDDFLQSLKLSR